MTEWEDFDASALYPDELESLLSVTAPLADTLGAALSVMADVVDVASLFVQGFSDAQAEAIKSVQDAINATVQQLTQTGVYYTVHMPPSRSGVMTPASWINQVSESFSDYSDENRPILVDPEAYVGAIAVMVTASTYRGLLQEYRSMFDTFEKKIADASQISRWPNRDDPWVVTSSVGRAPDWGSKKLGDIVPPVNVIAKKILSFSSAITGAASGSTIYSAFAEQLRSKSETLTAFSEEITGLLGSIDELLNWDGAYILPIYGQGDSEWVKSSLVSSTGGPRDLEDSNYTAGVMFLSTGGTTAEIDLLFDLFGMPKEVTG